MTTLAGKYIEGIGRRKAAVARVRLYEGSGNFVVNEKSVEQYFTHTDDMANVLAPLNLANAREKFTVSVHVKGGGTAGQSDAVAHGLARALLKSDENLHAPLRKNGFLTRDARVKERKKPGLKRARKAKQYTKR